MRFKTGASLDGEPHNVTLRFMFSNDLRKVGTSIKLQLSVITYLLISNYLHLFGNCARPVFEHVVFQVWINKIIKASCW
jgi:hypothetical protein